MLLSSIYILLVGFTNCFFFRVSWSTSDFSLEGDYLLGGFFILHEIQHDTTLFSAETTECSRAISKLKNYNYCTTDHDGPYTNEVNYGASSYALSNKLKYPSFVRTIPSNKDLIEMIIYIIRWFGWNWVAFIGSQDDYSLDGLKLFNKYISNTGICLAYQEGLSLNANYSLTLKKINMLNINVVVFAVPQYASKIIKAAIANNIQDKVWIASQGWAMNQQIPREPGIGKIGTVIGITERLLSLPGFNEFVYKARETTDAGQNEVQRKTPGRDKKVGFFTQWPSGEI